MGFGFSLLLAGAGRTSLLLGGFAWRHGFRRARVGAVLGMGLALAACGTSEKDKPRQPCPPVSVVSEAETLVRFRPGPGRDLTDILAQARIADYFGNCEYDDGKVEIEMTVVIAVSRGPAERTGEVEFAYFVAVPELHPDPAAKSIFPVKVPFKQGATRALFTDRLELELPARGDKTPDLTIRVGFQLTPDQLDYNRAQAPTRR